MSPRRFLLILAAAAAAAALLQGVTGLTELVLYAGPLLLVAGLLPGGRFVGEERILARLGALRRRAPRAVSTGWDRARDIEAELEVASRDGLSAALLDLSHITAVEEQSAAGLPSVVDAAWPAVRVTALPAPPDLRPALQRAHALEGIEDVADDGS